MSLSRAFNWVKKTAISTGIGTLFGVSTGALSGTIGTAIVLSASKRHLDYTVADGAAATTLGSTAIFAMAGLLHHTRISPLKVLGNVIMCDSACGLFIPLYFVASQALAGLIGRELLQTILNELPYDDAMIDPAIGSAFTMAIMALAACVVCNWDYSQDTMNVNEMDFSNMRRNVSQNVAELSDLSQNSDAGNPLSPEVSVILNVSSADLPVESNNSSDRKMSI